ncbi:hypothetical protein ACED29_17255 [Shewanella sp. 5S214]|uniref:hypothetical protein n=1 Tax=Shewanella sp. 5S214 TaxID=3229999 RepID=UPI00352CE8C8
MSKFIPTFLEDLGFDSSICPDGIHPNYLAINENHVISRDKVGNVVSRFKDLRWDFSHYASRELRINFTRFYEADKTDSKEVYDDLKLCSFYLIYYPNFKTMRTVDGAIRDLFFFADNATKKGISFRQSLNDISALQEIEVNNKLSESEKFRKFSSILASYNRLGKLSALFSAFDFYPENKAYKFVLKCYHIFKKNRIVNQTLVIPTRLFAEIITECSHILGSIFSETDFIFNGKKLLVHEVIERLLADSISICLESSNNDKFTCIDQIPNNIWNSRRWSLRFSKSQERYWKALQPFGISHFKDLKVFFSYYFSSGRALVMIFTGMRFEESSNVPFNGFERISLEGEEACFIRSWTTKLESESARFASWFTSDLFIDYNKSIQTLVRIFYSKYKSIDIDSVDQSMYPLFPALVGKTQINPFFNHPSFNNFNAFTGWRPYEPFTSAPTRFCVTDEDIDELQRLNPDSDWQSRGIKVGVCFPFANHQFRRTLVVYAARSGLISLPSLQTNLQHLSNKMTAYYANSASYADNFILANTDESSGNKSLKAFVNEFRDEQCDAEVDSIWEDVVKTDDILFGVYGSFLQRKKELGTMPAIFESRDNVRKAVKKGKLAYKKTPLGGCCSLSSCEKAAFTSITACVLCENAVLNSVSAVKLEVTRHNFNLKLAQFDPRSPFALQIKKEIKAIDTALSNRIFSIEGNKNNV